ncbi:hypothetical protein Poli38472_004474 [Pythium oligandrum]|uniref:Aminodeoxychorismate lyase n=1 Tax=Pythium oligandrum TaxID=41045 RepID=A0A8K1CAU4_PYTOL|nr:hypothetical protein Poli38472_004474 [Pythium oligandrum]|eukprot:TMW59405.1 hypothetical protein Poli38472_004474 [Pythium oligandrum]
MAMTASMAMTAVVKMTALNERICVEMATDEAPETPSARAFLMAHPRGVYTCARAVPTATQFCLVLWRFHLDRLAVGWRSERQETGDTRALVGVLQETSTRLVTDALARWAEAEKDAMVTVLWWEENKDEVNVRVHVCTMPQVRSLTANVLIHGEPRINPLCKHSRWIDQRVPLEQHMRDVTTSLRVEHGEDFVLNEAILSSPLDRDGVSERRLLEGLITNFFVVKDDVVITADADMLKGSTRELVLRACKELDVPVKLEAPTVKDLRASQGAFVTSCVQVLVPVVNVFWSDVEGGQKYPHLSISTSHSTLALIERIRNHIQSHWLKWE